MRNNGKKLFIGFVAAFTLFSLGTLVQPKIVCAQGNGTAGGGSVVAVQTYGSTYSELSARWWQWILSIPAAVNPNLDPDGQNCGQGQFDDVWFLAGAFGGTVTRDKCVIPAGKPIFFPIVNTLLSKPYGYETLLSLREQAAGYIDSIKNLSCTLDKSPCVNDISKFRVRSPSFTVIGAQNGVLPPGQLTVPGNTDSLVSDGYWLLLDPLAPGHHTLAFSADGLSVTYSLTVE